MFQKQIDKERALSLKRCGFTRLAASTLCAAGWTLQEAVQLLAKKVES